MSKPLGHAKDVIEKFGGIRPMSAKTDIPVTTIQGWKKRGAIPQARHSEILKIAARENINLAADERLDHVANENDLEHVDIDLQAAPIKADDPKDDVVLDQRVDTGMVQEIEARLRGEMKAMEKRIVSKSAVIAVGLVGLAVVGLLILLWPSSQKGFENEDARLAALEAQIADVKNEQESTASLIPENLSAQLAALKEQAAQGYAQAKTATATFIEEQAPMVQDTIEVVQEKVSAFWGTPEMVALQDRFAAFQSSVSGSQVLDQSVSDLSAAFVDVNVSEMADEQMNQFLVQARAESEALSQSLDAVPQEDLKAAALLLGLTQFRSTLLRSEEPFEEDLALLKKLAGEDNVELQAALDQLAPHAQSGVLSPAGLSQELKKVSGDVVVASLKGENVSFTEKAQARLNEVLSVKKEGELVTGTPTQSTLNEAETLLQQGDITGAIEHIKALDGGALQAALPWLSKAQASKAVREAKKVLEQVVDHKLLKKVTGQAGSSGKVLDLR